MYSCIYCFASSHIVLCVVRLVLKIYIVQQKCLNAIEICFYLRIILNAYFNVHACVPRHQVEWSLLHIISTSSSSLCTNANNSLIVFISSLTKCLSCALRQQSVTLINIKTLVRHEVQSEHSAPLCQCLRRYIKTKQFALSS